MSTRSERIKILIENSGKSYQDLEKLTGVKKSSLQRYASGETAKIPLTVIEKLSKAFGVSQAYLMGWSDDKENSPTGTDLSEGEQKLLEVYRRASDNVKPVLVKAIESLESMPLDKLQFVADLIGNKQN